MPNNTNIHVDNYVILATPEGEVYEEKLIRNEEKAENHTLGYDRIEEKMGIEPIEGESFEKAVELGRQGHVSAMVSSAAFLVFYPENVTSIQKEIMEEEIYKYPLEGQKIEGLFIEENGFKNIMTPDRKYRFTKEEFISTVNDMLQKRL